MASAYVEPPEPAVRARTAEEHARHMSWLRSHYGEWSLLLFGSSHLGRFATTGKGLLLEGNRVANCGVGGDRVRHGRWRWENGLRSQVLLNSRNPLLHVVLCFGGNDLTSNVKPLVVCDEYMALIRDVRAALPSHAWLTVFLPPPARKAGLKPAKQQKIYDNFWTFGQEMQRRLTAMSLEDGGRRANGSPHPETCTMMLAYYDAEPRAEAQARYAACLELDGVHMSRAGYEILADMLMAQLECQIAKALALGTEDDGNGGEQHDSTGAGDAEASLTTLHF